MNYWRKVKKEFFVLSHFHELLHEAEKKKIKVISHYNNKLDKLHNDITKLEDEENKRLNDIRIENERIEKERINKEYKERKAEEARLENIRIETEKKNEEERKENERIALLERIEARRIEDFVIMVQSVWRGTLYRKKIRTLAEAARAILIETHRQMQEKETLELTIEDELSNKYRELYKEEYENQCFSKEDNESKVLNWYVREEIKTILYKQHEIEKEERKKKKKKEEPRSRTPKTDELRRRLELERQDLPSLEFIMPGTLEYEHKHHPFRITKPDPNLLSSPISTPISSIRPRPPSRVSISPAQSPATKSRPTSRPDITPIQSPIQTSQKRPTSPSELKIQSQIGSPISSVRRPISPAQSTARSISSTQSKRTKLPPILKDAETGEDLEFTKAIWSSKEGRVELNNPRGLTSYGTGRLDINPPPMNSLQEPYKPNAPYKPQKFNSPHRLKGGKNAGKAAIDAFLLEKKYSAPTRAMIEEMSKPPRHELVDKFLREGPLAPQFHVYWDKKTDSVKKIADALEDDYEPLDEPQEDLEDVVSIASSDTNATKSIETFQSETDLWSESILTEDSNMLAFSDCDDCSIIPSQLALSNKKFWRKVERENYEDIFDIVSKLEWNKKWTNEKKFHSEELRRICLEIARWKTNNMKLVISSISSEHEKEKVRLMAEWKLEEMGKSKRHELAKLRALHEQERHDKRTFYRNMQYDNEILLINKLDKYGLIF